MPDEKPELPEDAAELAGWADPSPAWMTLNRSPDGTVYLVSWWHGTHTVMAMVRPDGSIVKPEE